MSIRITSLIPNKWAPEGAFVRGFVFGLITFTVAQLIELIDILPRDESYLLSGTVAVSILYWLPPIPTDSYVRWFLTHVVVLFGAYVSVFKIPWFLSSIMNKRFAGILCLLVYCGGCRLLIMQKARLSTREINE